MDSEDSKPHITECCLRRIQPDERYCPKCGWECRVLERGQQEPPRPQLGNCRTPHFLGEPTPDRKALTQTAHYELPNGLCKDWRPTMNTAMIRCDRTTYMLPAGKHKGDNLRSFFGVPQGKDLWWDSRDTDRDEAILVFGEAELLISDGDRFHTTHKQINGGD